MFFNSLSLKAFKYNLLPSNEEMDDVP